MFFRVSRIATISIGMSSTWEVFLIAPFSLEEKLWYGARLRTSLNPRWAYGAGQQSQGRRGEIQVRF